MKTDNFLITLGRSIEIILTISLIFLSYYFIFNNLDNADKILTTAIYIIVLLVNFCKIPIAAALMFAQKIFYKLLFLFTLLILTLVSFETYLQVFELYIVNYNFFDEYKLNNNSLFVLSSFIFAIFGIIFAMPGLYLRKRNETKEIIQYYKEF